MTKLGVLAVLAWVSTISSVARAQPEKLDLGTMTGPMLEAEPPLVDLYTFGPGEEIFERFGHAAICLRYHDAVTYPGGMCFNWGVTDFEEDGLDLTTSFLRGRQEFWVEPTKYAMMYQYYAGEDRDIYRTELPLDADERRAIEAELWRDISEDNRYYLYDHLSDNCTTRIRDLLDTITGGKLKASPTAAAAYPLSYRDLGRRGLAGLPPLVAITDFVLGRKLDEHPTRYQAMFWPDVLREEVAKRLGGTTTMIRKREGAPIDPVGSTGYVTMLLIALGVTAPLIAATILRRFQRATLALATTYTGLWGLAIWALVIVSPIPAIRWNELVLVLVPFDLALPLLRAERRVRYARVRLAICFLVSVLAAIGILHQPVWIPLITAVLPLALVATGRSDRRGKLVDGQRVEDVALADPRAPSHRDGELGVA